MGASDAAFTPSGNLRVDTNTTPRSLRICPPHTRTDTHAHTQGETQRRRGPPQPLPGTTSTPLMLVP